jgi:hypothetical protein
VLATPLLVSPILYFFIFLIDVWIRTQSAAVASRCATNLATYLPTADIYVSDKELPPPPTPGRVQHGTEPVR